MIHGKSLRDDEGEAPVSLAVACISTTAAVAVTLGRMIREREGGPLP
jgi:hypothetical protein